MKESDFVQEFFNIANALFKDIYKVKTKSSLLYELMLNDKLETQISNFKEPKRGVSAFETDVCIYENKNNVEVPRVVIEFKTDITTHDILTYSAKAEKHKTVYPFLRYGLLASEIDNIPERFFIHNEHIDFFIAMKSHRDSNMPNLIKDLIQKEIDISKTLEQIHFHDMNFDYYRRDIIFRNYKEAGTSN